MSPSKYFALISILLLSACQGIYELDIFSKPSVTQASKNKEGQDYTRGNKSPYVVFGKTYEVMPSSLAYREVGVASWYGKKFHGRLTSNGEIYDMFKVSAAHKALPLPSKVRVTNLENGKSLIIRVNDRGPFHGNRLIDLSYQAALKLEFTNQGTAKVLVEALDELNYPQDQTPKAEIIEQPKALILAAAIVEPPKIQAPTIMPPKSFYIQLGAFSQLNRAETLKKQIELFINTREMITLGVSILQGQLDAVTLHKVWLGPFSSEGSRDKLMFLVQEANLGQAFRVEVR